MENQKEKETDKKKKKEKQEDTLPFCTNAPSAEHARGDSDDEPCDDYRKGE